MICATCGSDEFFELPDGHAYCCVCQAVGEEIEENHDDFLVAKGSVVAQKKATAEVANQVNWTFTEAFNIILYEQAKLVMQFCELDEQFLRLVLAIWVSFLEATEIGFKDNVKSSKLPKLQSIVRARDVALIVDKKESITYPGRKPKHFTNSAFRIGSKVMQRVQNECHDVLGGGGGGGSGEPIEPPLPGSPVATQADEPDPFDLPTKSPSKMPLGSSAQLQKHMKTKRPCTRKTKSEYQHIYDIALKKINLVDQCESEDERIEHEILLEEERTNKIEDAGQRLLAERKLQEMKRQLRLSSITKKLEEISNEDTLRTFYQKRKRSYCRTLAASMTSCKTLGIIYLALRILNLDVYSFDLVRWINHGHIPFFNTFQLLPSNWNFIINDFHSLNSLYSPQPNAINQHATNIANLIGIRELKLPALEKLIVRFVDDLNLPNLLSDLIVSLFRQRYTEERKVRELVEKSIDRGGSIPDYESIVLAMVVLTLKKLFGVNGLVEKESSRRLRQENGADHLFIWSDWEAHTRLKMESISKHFFPAFDQKAEELENLDLMYAYYKKVVHIDKKPEIASKKKKIDKDAILSLPNIFKNILQSDVDFDDVPAEPSDASILLSKPNLHPLKTLTKFILDKHEPRNYKLLSMDFRSKSIAYLFEDVSLLPDDFKVINTRIFCLDKIADWSDSFKYLIKLSCFILNKREHSFLDKLCYVENSVFKHYNVKKRKRRTKKPAEEPPL